MQGISPTQIYSWLVVLAFVSFTACKPARTGYLVDLRGNNQDSQFLGQTASRCTIDKAFKAPSATALALADSNAASPAPTPATPHYLSIPSLALTLRSNSALLLQELAKLFPLSSLFDEKSPQFTPAVAASPRLLDLLPDANADLNAAKTNREDLSLAYTLQVQGIELCDFSTKLIVVSGQLMEMGESLPSALKNLPRNFNDTADRIAAGKRLWKEDHGLWTKLLLEAEATHQQTIDRLTPPARADGSSRFGLLNSQRCLYRENHSLVPGWKISSYFSDDRPYQVVLKNERFHEVVPQYFNGNSDPQVGNARVYQYGRTDSFRTISLPRMQRNGFLCSSELSTSVPSQYPMAFSSTLTYDYPANDHRFLEVSAFASVSEMWSWYLAKDPNANWGETQVDLFFTEDPVYKAGGPCYENPVFKGITRPRIVIPTELNQNGTILLINLATDSDTLIHELGHHILFRYVGISSAEEHRILHEAIADTFMYYMRRDPCLGETICPASSKLCYYGPKQSCLRQADNTLNYNDNIYQQSLAGDIHRRSQLISGFMWDLSSKNGMDSNYVSDLLYKAISYLPREISFTDFFIALFKADSALSKGVNACTIAKAAKARGLTAQLGTIPCENFQAKG